MREGDATLLSIIVALRGGVGGWARGGRRLFYLKVGLQNVAWIRRTNKM